MDFRGFYLIFINAENYLAQKSDTSMTELPDLLSSMLSMIAVKNWLW